MLEAMVLYLKHRMNTLASGNQGVANALCRCSADYVVAIQGSPQRNRIVEILSKLFAELFELSDRQLIQLASAVQAKTDGLANLFMRRAEGNTLVDEIGRRSHCVEIPGLRGSFHPVEAEGQSACERRQQGQHAAQRRRNLEGGLLRLLHVLVVGQRKSLQDHGQRRHRSQKTSALSANQLRQVGILL